MRVLTKTGLAAISVAFLLGALAGWWYRGPNSTLQQAAPKAADRPSIHIPTSQSAMTPSETGAEDSGQVEDEKATLNRMLAERQFEGATAFYYQAVQADPASKFRLRPTVDTYFQHCAENCDAGVFLNLVDAWLATFYDDIPVLIRLAVFQADQGQPEAAANTLLLAKTYAFSADQQLAVQQARDRLTQRTDKLLDGEQRWIELLGYYEFLATIDFTTLEFELRRALLYRRIGELSRASALLGDLKNADDGSNPQWTATIDGYLGRESPEALPANHDATALSQSIPIEKHGNGVVVRVTLNERDALKLLLDTGASITALTQDSFRRLYRPELSLLGTQLFKTAGGYTRGDIYRVSTLSLGNERIDNSKVAVLDRLEMDNIDGLLGMNILRLFRFEIDHAAGLMYLERR